uniref:AcmO n=1 Tax=Streptomyces sp. JCM 9888 TaxID=1570103 RepID=A0A0B5H0U4_9ACTN|nr:AcmO [Streptomyces sp. JCM 9888]
MLAEVLRGCDRLLHLRAEINPFLRIAGLGHPHSGSGSDVLDAGDLEGLGADRRSLLDGELSLEIGNPAHRVDDEERFGLDTAWRLTVQWPRVDWQPQELAHLATRTLRQMRSDTGTPSWERYRALLIAELRRRGAAVDGAFYDGASEASGGGAPGEVLVEEPPFVSFGPWRHASAQDLCSRPLVVKTPSNAYRMAFLRALFPNARVRVIHLTRNPAASVNGLYDGWRHGGFHAHRMSEPLDIAGYTDHRPKDRHWWKFDLPPGWSEYTAAPLPQVCAFQWHSAHEWILRELSQGTDHLRVRFEDLTGTPQVRTATFERITRWLDVPMSTSFQRAAHGDVAPVAATVKPSPGRWRSRASLITGALDERIHAMARELGYGSDGEWI